MHNGMMYADAGTQMELLCKPFMSADDFVVMQSYDVSHI